jgi:hypothetical protein
MYVFLSSRNHLSFYFFFAFNSITPCNISNGLGKTGRNGDPRLPRKGRNLIPLKIFEAHDKECIITEMAKSERP